MKISVVYDIIFLLPRLGINLLISPTFIPYPLAILKEYFVSISLVILSFSGAKGSSL